MDSPNSLALRLWDSRWWVGQHVCDGSVTGWPPRGEDMGFAITVVWPDTEQGWAPLAAWPPTLGVPTACSSCWPWGGLGGGRGA